MPRARKPKWHVAKDLPVGKNFIQAWALRPGYKYPERCFLMPDLDRYSPQDLWWATRHKKDELPPPPDCPGMPDWRQP